MAKLTNETTKKRILNAIPNTRGNILLIAKKCELDQKTIHLYKNTYPEVLEAINLERESIVDLAESGLISALVKKEAWAIALTLKTLGRGRGYAEKQEVENSGEIKIKVVYGNSD